MSENVRLHANMTLLHIDSHAQLYTDVIKLLLLLLLLHIYIYMASVLYYKFHWRPLKHIVVSHYTRTVVQLN